MYRKISKVKQINQTAFVGTHLEGSVGDDTESESAKVQNPSPSWFDSIEKPL